MKPRFDPFVRTFVLGALSLFASLHAPAVEPSHPVLPVPGSGAGADSILTTYTFAILDSNLANIPTYSFGNDAFLQIDITGADAVAQVFASDESIAPSAGGLPVFIAAPQATPIPEPSTYGLVAIVTLASLAF